MELLRALPDDTADALITDPPYSSGGLFRSDRQQSIAAKYVQSGVRTQRHEFSGDNRDQRSWTYWVNLWLGQCLRIVRPGGYALVFTDWRQLPATTDALQAAGWIWRGIVVWDKGAAARAPHKGYFRHQCEYLVWGTRGKARKATHGGPFAGCHQESVRQADKHHITGKPTALLRRLIAVVPPGATVLDPFAGSGTTAVACREMRRRSISMELSPEYAAIARHRIAQARPTA